MVEATATALVTRALKTKTQTSSQQIDWAVGDLCDFYSISRWTKNPADRNFSAELKACRQTLAWLREQFPDIPIILKCGNHEERWEHWLWQHAPEISDEPEMGYATWLHLDKYGIELIKDQRIVKLGDLAVCHGHELPKGQRPQAAGVEPVLHLGAAVPSGFAPVGEMLAVVEQQVVVLLPQSTQRSPQGFACR